MSQNVTISSKDSSSPNRVSAKKFSEMCEKYESRALTTGEVVVLIQSIGFGTSNFHISTYRPSTIPGIRFWKKIKSLYVHDDLREATDTFLKASEWGTIQGPR